MMFKIILVALHVLYFGVKESLSLFPQESESRELKILDGLWNFRADNSSSRNVGIKNKWYSDQLKKSGSVITMPVPSSYNDITQDAHIRDFVGWVWYDRDFYAPNSWNAESGHRRVVLRFESCHYFCMVWLNGKQIMEHDGGHLPFEADVTEHLSFGKSNLVTVAANNTLTPKTLPPGDATFLEGGKYPGGKYYVQKLQMDFFNYAGIHRPVKLYITPTTYLHDITLETDVIDGVGKLNFTTSVATVSKNGKEDSIEIIYDVIDDNGERIAGTSGNDLYKGGIDVPNVNLWWPVGMGHKPAYLYTLKVTVKGSGDVQDDVYRIKFGFRTIKVTDKAFLINGMPFYFKGFGMHEDADIRGKGLDLPTIMKNYYLIDWIGANSFRTSHYPYADEILYLADERGIVVIDECPGVGILEQNMGDENIAHHMDVMKELVHRDKNHPSVVMWSVANEPDTKSSKSDPYFKAIIDYTRQLDGSRPITFVSHMSPYDDKAVKYVDVVCFNRYYTWYSDSGYIDLIPYQLERELKLWYQIHGKLLLMTEYGADAVAGLYQNPPVMYTEDYQVAAVKSYFPLFDEYKKSYFVGEMIWNFADFATAQGTTRVAGNKKGLFTRSRQPKRIAYVIRERYRKMPSLNLVHTTDEEKKRTTANTKSLEEYDDLTDYNGETYYDQDFTNGGVSDDGADIIPAL